MVRVLIIGAVILFTENVLAQRFFTKNYRYRPPWTGKTTSVEEFDEDIRNMDSKKLQRYLNELRRVKDGLKEMRRESETLERELGFDLGGFPLLMDNSEKIIRHALDSVTDQLQRRIGHEPDQKEIENLQNFKKNVKSADRSTLQKNLARLQQTKEDIADAKRKAQALKNDLGFDFDQDVFNRAEDSVNYGMNVINHRMEKMDHRKTSHPHIGNANVTNTIKKVDNALQTANEQQLGKFDNEFKKMKHYMDNVRSQLDNFYRDVGFELDGVFEPLKMAESILDHGLNAINRQLQGRSQHNPVQGPQQGAQQNPSTSASQQPSYNQQNVQGNSPQPQGTQTSQRSPGVW